jgi:predicted nucleic acid-binding protein
MFPPQLFSFIEVTVNLVPFVSEAYFLDSSALVKRYVEEDGTAWVRRLTRRNGHNRIYLTRITPVEVTSSIIR